ncbi:MAG: hypothetical protein A2136_01320 [Chloroflexi bacterium RBG_16_54_11]|nr:MAG: hypothetical protein A2136_01320 [Chloroflexi bacterium RBG_16_54_11]
MSIIAMKSVEYDLRYIQAGLEVLEDYLLSEDVFWPMGAKPPLGEPDFPQLTLGGMLLARARLVSQHLYPGQQEQVQRAVSSLDRYRTKWRVAWEKKARQCFQVRQRMWGDYLRDYQENQPDNADRYAYEVRLRVMLELLRSEYNIENKAEVELIMALDGYLKSALVPDGFIWEPELEAGFPPGVYWFLYGKLLLSTGKRL